MLNENQTRNRKQKQMRQKTIVDLKNEECFAFTQSPYENLAIMRCCYQQNSINEEKKFQPDDAFIILKMYNPLSGYVRFMNLSTFDIYMMYAIKALMQWIS